MSRKKNLLMVLLILVVLLSAVVGVFWHLRHYVIVDMEFYPKGVQQLDLRDQQITPRHYEKLSSRMPDCTIHWNVPFQNGVVANDAEEIILFSLNQEDIRTLDYFPSLKTVKAEGCTDYALLQTLQQQRPDLYVEYSVALGGERYSPETQKLTLTQITLEEIDCLQYFPSLQSVLCAGGSPEAVSQLKDYCQTRQVDFQIAIGDDVVPLDAQSITADAITEAQLEMLPLFTNLKQLHLRRPEASAEKLQELQQKNPNMTVTWEQEIWGQLLDSTLEEIDLSGAGVTSLEELDQKMAYFPRAKQVFLGECGLDNELLAAHREQAREQYKLVWTVSLGEKLKSRTDATTFMPVREYVYYFNDEEAYNLRYCEDMICIDIGHMSIHNIDFVEYMPNLQYLILAHTQLQYIDPISTCKKLKFLELDWSPLKDLSPLVGCTALEDLNLGMTYADFTPIEQMTWLKNLWMVDCSSAARYRMSQVMTDTKVMIVGAATVANGWRNLENYYAMRDLLGMHYMSW